MYTYILFLASYDDRVNLLGILRDIYGSEVVYMAPPVLPDLVSWLALRVFLNEPQSDYTQGFCTVAKTSRYPTAHCIAHHGIPVIPPVELSSTTRKRTLRCSKDWSPWACTHVAI